VIWYQLAPSRQGSEYKEKNQKRMVTGTCEPSCILAGPLHTRSNNRHPHLSRSCRETHRTHPDFVRANGYCLRVPSGLSDRNRKVRDEVMQWRYRSSPLSKKFITMIRAKAQTVHGRIYLVPRKMAIDHNHLHMSALQGKLG